VPMNVPYFVLRGELTDLMGRASRLKHTI